MYNRKMNEAMAQIILRHKLANKEQIQNCLTEITENRDIGMVMVMNGYLKQAHYQQIKNYLLARQQTQLSTASSTSSAPADMDTRPVAPRTRPQPSATPVSPTAAPPAAPAPAAITPSAAPPPPAKPPPIATEKAHKEHIEEGPADSLPSDFRQDSGRGRLPFPKPEKITPQSSLQEILVAARRARASDVHISTQSPVTFRRYGKLLPATDFNLSPKQIEKLVTDLLSKEEMKQFLASGDFESAYTIPGGGRYRLTIMEQRFGWDFSARVIPYELRTFEECGLPEHCKVLTTYAQGMVLITGPMGCGKTSTLCSMIDMINKDREDHIITVENPIEFVFKGEKCQITQRQIGLHTLSQGNALKGALRQDPDILVVSELRDVDSMRLAITAAETGHLVLATMNTANATRTIDRLIDSFPPEERDVTRNMVSESLRGVVSQQLVPNKEGTGMVPVFEILMVTQAVSNLIRKNNTNQLESAMVSGRSHGMVTLDNAFEDAIAAGKINGEEAYHRATNPKRFIKFAPKVPTGGAHA